jgi:hypothetical protein
LVFDLCPLPKTGQQSNPAQPGLDANPVNEFTVAFLVSTLEASLNG